VTEETLFANALEKADPAERAAFVRDACGADVELRRRMESLLAAHDRAGPFLKKSPVEPPPEPTKVFPAEDGSDDVDDLLGFLSPPTRPDSLGRIDQYEILELLGRGGFGTVFRAYDDVLQRVVAVKVLSPSMAATSPARKRFLREARSSAAVRHENVVQVHAVEEQPLPYLVMEFVPGETLQQRIDRTGPLDVREILRIGRQIAEGLAAAHATGLIHRDIKPSNVLIGGPDDRVKITDFGLARAADDASLTRSGVVAGTPMYMAPEQAKGDTLDHRADLFSLGSVLYVMATGRPPFRASNTFAVLKRVAEESPRPMREVIPEVPEWFCRIVEKLHAKKPDERFQTAGEVAEVLKDCESQITSPKGLKDYSKIPARRPATPNQTFRRFAFALWGVVVLFWVVNKFGEPTYLYAMNQASVEFRRAPGLMSVRVLKDGEPVGEWMDTNSRPSLTLPPGRYTLETNLAPGQEIEHWLVEKGSFSTARVVWPAGVHVVLTLERGQLATLTAKVIGIPSPEARAIAPFEDLVAATTKNRNRVRQSFEAGTVNKGTMIAAEIDLIEAQIKLAGAKRDRAAVVKGLEELVAQRTAERDFAAARHDAGRASVEERNRAEARKAEAEVRLAEAKSECRAGPKP
jgi:serine/threonine protein kinase